MAVSVVIAMADRFACELACRDLNRYRGHFRCTACAETSKEVLKCVAEKQADVAILSTHLNGESNGGLNVLRELRASGSPTRVIIVVESSQPGLVINAFAAGARGVFCRTDSSALLRKCIRCVHEGQIWAANNQLLWVLESFAQHEPARIVDAKGLPLLSDREEQIVQLVAEGLPNSQISAKLNLSPHTIKNHLFRIYEKLGISNRLELLLYAWRGREPSPVLASNPPKPHQRDL